MFSRKKGEMGIGTLIIFIALLLVAAVAAGVLIQTTGSLQEKALTTGDQAKAQIATNAVVVEVAGQDGQDGDIETLSSIMKLAPGSDEIKLADAIITANTFDKTATLSYAGTGAPFIRGANGFYTVREETFTGGPGAWETVLADYDNDDTNEVITGGLNGANVVMNLSDGANITLGACAGGTFTSALGANNYISAVSGTCTSNTNTSTVTITPVNEGFGDFVVEYLQQGSNYVEGNLQRGDVIKIYMVVPRDFGQDEDVRLNFIPKIGTPTLTQFVTPEVISTKQVYLYP